MNEELLQAIKCIINPLVEKQDQMSEQINAIQLTIENNVRKDINLLIEGHQMILERMPEQSEVYALKDKIKILESVLKEHTKILQKLNIN